MTEFLLYKFQFFKKKNFEEISKFKKLKNKNIKNLILNIIPKEDLFCFLLINEENKVLHIEDLFHIIHGIELFKNENFEQKKKNEKNFENFSKKKKNQNFSENFENNENFFEICISVKEILKILKNELIFEIGAKIRFLQQKQNFENFGLEILVKSYFMFLLEIKEEILELRNYIEIESNNFNSEIIALNLLIKNNPKFEKSKIYPFFKKISKIYFLIFLSFEKILDILKIYKKIKNENFLNFEKLKNFQNFENLEKIEEKFFCDNNFDFLDKKNLELIKPSNWENFYNIKLKYEGFDIISLLEEKKLKFVNLNLGIFKKKKNFLVSKIKKI